MTEKEKAKLGYLYNANYDKDLCNERRNSYNICKKYNDIKNQNAVIDYRHQKSNSVL